MLGPRVGYLSIGLQWVSGRVGIWSGTTGCYGCIAGSATMTTLLWPTFSSLTLASMHQIRIFSLRSHTVIPNIFS